MVVICAGTTGYSATVDLRYLWMRQKRLQGSYFATDEQVRGINDIVVAGAVDPCASKVFSFDELPEPHQLMYENRYPQGNMAVLVGAKTTGNGGHSHHERIDGTRHRRSLDCALCPGHGAYGWRSVAPGSP